MSQMKQAQFRFLNFPIFLLSVDSSNTLELRRAVGTSHTRGLPQGPASSH